MQCKTKHKKISHGGPYATKDVYLTNISRPVSSMFLLMAFHDCLSLKTSLVDIPNGLKVLEISETLANSPPLTERAEGLTLQASALLWALTTLVFRQPISCQRSHSTMAHSSQSSSPHHTDVCHVLSQLRMLRNDWCSRRTPWRGRDGCWHTNC